MKAVALGVVFLGYSVLVFGWDHLRGGCLSVKDIVWPSGGVPTDPCAGGGSQ